MNSRQQCGKLGEGASESAGAVLSKLLSPPMVPDASWFAAASAALLSATSLDPPLVLATLSLHSLVTVISDEPSLYSDTAGAFAPETAQRMCAAGAMLAEWKLSHTVRSVGVPNKCRRALPVYCR